MPTTAREQTLIDWMAVALAIARDDGLTDGKHHKQWVIDQMVRALLGDDPDHYQEWLAQFTEQEWDPGIAP